MQNRAIGEKENGIEKLHDSEPRLVDAENDGPLPSFGHGGLQHVDDLKSRSAVEAGSGFVENKHFGVVNHFHADGDPPPLTAGDSADSVVADSGVGDVAESEFLDEGVDLGGEVGGREGEAEPGGEGEGLLDGEEREEGVLLGDVAGDFVEMGRVDGAVVEEEGAGVRGGFAGEDLEEGGLSGAAGADDGEDLAGFGSAIDVGKQVADGGGMIDLVKRICGEDVGKWGFGVMDLDLEADSNGFYLASFSFFLLLHFSFLFVVFCCFFLFLSGLAFMSS